MKTAEDKKFGYVLLQNRPGALHPDASSTSKALTCFCLNPPQSGGQIQATRFAGGS
jgi:hypothetical protein